MLNAIGCKTSASTRSSTRSCPSCDGHDTAIVANVFGETEAEYVEVCEKLDAATGVAAIELNVSCPNTEAGGMIFGNDAASLGRDHARVPRSDALSPLGQASPTSPTSARRREGREAEGADAVSLVNTFVGMVDRRREATARARQRQRRPVGPAIRPRGLDDVAGASRRDDSDRRYGGHHDPA
jgi:dihydroorotate dehydrogenase (NAD+) catalytic subunit